MSLLSRVLLLPGPVLPATFFPEVKLGSEVFANHGFQELQGKSIDQALGILKILAAALDKTDFVLSITNSNSDL